jgi:hypothetical protein
MGCRIGCAQRKCVALLVARSSTGVGGATQRIIEHFAASSFDFNAAMLDLPGVKLAKANKAGKNDVLGRAAVEGFRGSAPFEMIPASSQQRCTERICSCKGSQTT